MNKMFLPIIPVFLAGILVFAPERSVSSDLAFKPISSPVNYRSVAEKITVSGKVFDESGAPLPGVNILEKGTNKGAATDAEGNFSLETSTGSTLVFSFLGFIAREVVVSNAQPIRISLKEDALMLNEFVAVGYQTMRKSDLTGSVSSVKAKELNLAAPTIGQALVGKLAGVQVSQVSGAPYMSTKIRVRGIGSINATSDPLYVIDGYPAGNDVFINPNDIESIDILKDAASAAIYGSRASGGVVLITTKRGKDGKGKLEYDVQTGFNQVSKKVKLMNSSQFAQLVIDGRNNSYRDFVENSGAVWSDAMKSDDNATRTKRVGNGGSITIPESIYNFATQQMITPTVNTDWQDELYRNGVFQRHNVSFSGGKQDLHYYLSGGYQNQDGLVVGTGQKRINLRANIDGKVNEKLKVGGNFSFTQNENQEIQEGRYDHSPVMAALLYAPFLPSHNADGSIAKFGMGALSAGNFGIQNPENPVAQATETNINRKGLRSSYNVNATYQIIKDLSFKVNLGMLTYNEKYNYYLPTSLSSGNFAPYSVQAQTAAKATAQNMTQIDQLAEFTLNYNKQWGKHHTDVLAGYTIQKTTSDLVSVSAQGFTNDRIQEISAKGADAAFFYLNKAEKYVYSLLSYLGRANYNYDNRYFLTATFRTDGSSRFGALNRYGYFPSVSAGWNISDEAFYHSFLGAESTVKLRASWGLSGNNNIGNYNSQQVMASPGGVVFGNNTIASALWAGGVKDPNLGWESTSQFNLGTDITLLKGRLGLMANLYLSNSYNLLFNQSISAISGSAIAGNSSILTNLKNSKIQNKGFDFQADGRLISSRDFKLNLTGNISLNRNKVLNMGGAGTIITNGAERSYKTHITQQGSSVGMFYGFKVLGIVTPQNISEVAPSAATSQKLRLGDLYFEDVNKDGVVNDADKTVIGNPYPKFTYGLGLNGSYKNLDFSTSFNGSYKNQVLDGQDYYLFNLEGSGNQYAVVDQRYRSESSPGNGSVYRSTRGASQSNSTRLSTFYIQDGTYFRCTDITLGYNIPNLLNGKLGISSARIYASVNNAFTLSKYKGYNPEVDYNNGSNLTPGVDYGVYPLARGYNLGLKLVF
ncbi:SusC/RagA family TonB-linked outer membrane protein [Dyadobacter frigoris]|uniref:TonB-dependent receptor n=1 Tax=Dyadobacter frigoris TaxID=2576211 RepID=A0A4U6CU17_9BACT|nr:TonB-dependent receptor [Dyadobacter frigoris]TKT87051.1 TonB-dependent receptor [Dyadobacter frigoris]GLU52745.1 SusC/RagA family TonB-linked outer membrane protein [Dyadobacter frigoris]